MPLENRLVDGRLYARPARQHHQPLPLVPLETPFDRRRRKSRSIFDCLLLAAGLVALASFIPF